MKSTPQIHDLLNGALAKEYAARQQYLIFERTALNWGLAGLSAFFAELRGDEEKHIQRIIDRILFLEGTPQADTTEKINTGNAVPLQLSLGKASELDAIANYRAGVTLAEAEEDYTTAGLFRSILAEEEDHVNETEAEEDKMAMMGLAVYLSTRVSAEAGA